MMVSFLLMEELTHQDLLEMVDLEEDRLKEDGHQVTIDEITHKVIAIIIIDIIIEKNMFLRLKLYSQFENE